MSPDGRRLYVANRMDDTLSVIDTVSNKSVGTLDLGGPKKITALRHGEQLFTASRYAFQGQFSCANCHIDSTFDGLTWDLEPDGFGKDIVDNRLIEDLSGTEPFKWNGGNPSLTVECGPRTALYIYRSESYSEKELAHLVFYITNLPPRPNRFRQPNGQLNEAQERGKLIFNRKTDKFGKPIPEKNQCAYCHSGPKYTSQLQFDVGTGKSTDRSPVFDTPHLVNIALTAPYLHDESASTLEEIWTVYNPHDQHGMSSDLTKDELNDLIEYLRTL
jgi:YVTN family beta-propeller protein